MRRALLALLTLCLALTLACGTLLYPERHGRKSGRVDPAVLIMDGALLFLFVIPGLVAFAIDFYTGAVYAMRSDGTLAVAHVDPATLTPERLEAILAAETGKRVALDGSELEAFPVRSATQLAELLRANAPSALASAGGVGS